jgi:predicted transposase YbfD/YdcC
LCNHGGIENNPHWQLALTFDEDASRIHQRNAAQNFASLWRIAWKLQQKMPGAAGFPGLPCLRPVLDRVS